MLGPLVNPAQPKYQLTGVFNMELARLYQYIFQGIPDKKFSIVYALDGYDEVSLTSDFKLKMNNKEETISPQSIGKQLLTKESLFGGDTVEEAGKIFTSILRGSGTFFMNGERMLFKANDVLFVPAGVEHRFENFTADFATWVIFYGQKGGENNNTTM